MKHAVPLYEFMPYGAPELIESRQRHLSQALILSSATALVLYALVASLASLIEGKTVAPVPRVIDITSIVTPPPIVNVAPPTTAMPMPRRASPLALPVPVPDATEPPVEATTPAQPAATGPGTASAAVTDDRSASAPPEGALPGPDTYVYVEHLPAAVKVVKPIYPNIAQEAGVEGLVMVKVLVGRDGRVLDGGLVEKFHVPMLDQAALEAARQWLFTPGFACDQPVACWTAIPFRFRLH